MPLVFANFVGLPVSHYFQSDHTARTQIERAKWKRGQYPAGIKWFKDLEIPYVTKVLGYEWETKPMEQLDPSMQLKRLYHLKLAPRPPIGISREIFWTNRRNAGFAKAFQVAAENAEMVMQRGRFNDKNYKMTDFLLSDQFKLKGYCQECVKDEDDEHFVWRQVQLLIT